LIVCSRLADERLWAEVLNLGGYDVLAIPFHAGEVEHTVNAACRTYRSKLAAEQARRRPARSERRAEGG
jgi:DNA-binding response OmpR family regulator